ncbi:hypothetical protein ACFQ0M_35525 [Kitasatospora aburaviensis]
MSTQGQFPGAGGESERTRRLRSLGLNEPTADEAFDRFAHLAASITRAPIAMVNFINDERQMFRGSTFRQPPPRPRPKSVPPGPTAASRSTSRPGRCR